MTQQQNTRINHHRHTFNLLDHKIINLKVQMIDKIQNTTNKYQQLKLLAQVFFFPVFTILFLRSIKHAHTNKYILIL